MEKNIKRRRYPIDDMYDSYVPARERTFELRKPSRLSPIVSTSPKGAEQPNPLTGEPITDTEGLRRAYQQGDAYAYGDTLYVAGSHTAKDWFDDFTKVPFYGDLRNSTRYQQAEKALKANPNITNVVGHSLGGSVVLELQKNYPNLQSRTYGAPVWDPFGEDQKTRNVDRYRNALDPFSIFDGSAKTSIKWNPFNSYSFTHDYSNIGTKFTTGNNANAYGWSSGLLARGTSGGEQSPSGTVSLTQ